MDRPDFPTMEQIEKADRERLAKWYRFLLFGDTPEQRKIQRRLAERFQKMGGMTPENSARRLDSEVSKICAFAKSSRQPFRLRSYSWR
jgi:hypothetical protein